MGEVVVYHPEDCMKGSFLPADMESRRIAKFDSGFKNHPSRRRTPSKGILKKIDRNTETAAAKVTKNLVMGHVKILKRGEDFNESLTILKEVNDRKVSNGTATTSEKYLVADRQASKVPSCSRRVLPKKKKSEKDKKTFTISSPKVEASKPEDLVLLPTHPDPEIGLKTVKNITECFAGSAFSDSPPPSSVPLPGFFRKATEKDNDATILHRILGLRI